MYHEQETFSYFKSSYNVLLLLPIVLVVPAQVTCILFNFLVCGHVSGKHGSQSCGVYWRKGAY